MPRTLFIVVVLCAQVAHAEQVLLLKSGSARAYDEVQKAFSETLGTDLIKVDVVPSDGSEVVVPKDVEVVFCLGPLAAKYAAANLRHVPLVYALVPDSTGIKGAGISMRASPDDAMQALRRLFPNVKTVGVVYTEQKLGAYVAMVREAAKAAQIELKTATAVNEADWANALSQLGAIDLFWLLPDPRLVSRGSITYVSNTLAGKGIPLAVFSPELLGVGATASVAPDLADTGRIAARLVSEALAGKHTQLEVFPKCVGAKR